jgi:hypothetical protein
MQQQLNNARAQPMRAEQFLHGTTTDAEDTFRRAVLQDPRPATDSTAATRKHDFTRSLGTGPRYWRNIV